MFDILIENPFWLLGGCAALLLALVAIGLLAILPRWKRHSVAPTAPPPTQPALDPTGPCMETIDHSGALRSFPLDPQGTVIGRADESDLCITPDLPGWETVSPAHARVYRHGGRWVLEDLGSMNGVYVNGSRTGHNLLRAGWRVDVGGVEFTFRLSPTPSEQEG